MSLETIVSTEEIDIVLDSWMFYHFWHDQISLPSCMGLYNWCQWRIQDFPDGGANPLIWAKKLLYGKTLAKTAWKWKK